MSIFDRIRVQGDVCGISGSTETNLVVSRENNPYQLTFCFFLTEQAEAVKHVRALLCSKNKILLL